MKIRKTTLQDLDRVMEIYAFARHFMAQHGNPNQWGPTHWPPESLIHDDIRNGNSYVCVNEDEKVIGTFYYIQGQDIEPTYRTIYDGAWIDDEKPYYVVHRIASFPEVHGVFKTMMEYLDALTDNIRIDTHKDNRIMQHNLSKYGFEYCGIIHIASGAERLAYQRLR